MKLSYYIFKKGSTHCDDVQEQEEDDSFELKEARVTIDKFLTSIMTVK